MERDTSDAAKAFFAALSEDRRRKVMARLAVLRPALEKEVSLALAADEASVPLRTAQRWLARYPRTGFRASPVRFAGTPADAGCGPNSSP